ncbi:LamG-like jellyroll fold domain-containing protein [Nitrospira lenta]|nr:LamG-like jellyroll fold domain-containing protein [Nitrospira lenta]
MPGNLFRALCAVLFATCFATTLHAQTGPTSGPLRIHPTNPRYFADATGRPVYLTGSHIWHNLQDGNAAAFNYSAYLDQLQANNHNFIRLWIAESPQADIALMPAPGFTGNTPWYQKATPLPYARTGPGTASDGLPKFNLAQFNQAYFDRLRARVIAARDRGIYVSIMLFNFRDVWNANPATPGRNVWRYHPYNMNNNANGINGDPNGNGNGEETHTLQLAAVTQLQDAYVRKVIDTVNDLNNVIFEISNDDQPGDPAWQAYVAALIRTYEAGKASQHAVGMTGTPGAGNAALLNGPADWVSFAAGSFNNSGDPFISSPPATDGTKVSLLDTDHLGYALFQNNPSATTMWVWKSFLRGHNPILMEDLQGSAGWVAGRSAMGHTRAYAIRMDLSPVAPRSALSTTGFCLASPGREYLAYQPGSGSFSVDLVSGTYTYEWFNPTTGTVAATGTAGASGGPQVFTPPFSGPAVLYLKSNTTLTSTASADATAMGHWPFDEGAGTIAGDKTGNGLHGTLVNSPTWSAGKTAGGLTFDGTNDYLQISNPGSLSPQKLTLSVWAKPSSFANPDWNSTLANVGLHEWTDGYYGLAIDTDGKPLALLNIGGGEQNAYYIEGAAISVGQWHHFALSYDNATLRLYVDGVAAGSLSINRIRTSNAAPLLVARRGDAGYHFKGTLDDIRVFSRAMTVTDIGAIMQGIATTSIPSSSIDTALTTAGTTTTAGSTTSTATASGTAIIGTTTYRASTDFSGVQGQRGWWYLDSTETRLTFNTAANSWQGSESYLQLTANDGHPGATRDAVRRWVAPGAGTAQISGTVRDLNSGGGGGVTVAIRKGTTVLWQQSIANGNTTGVTFNVSTTLAAGDAVDFVINRGADGSNSYDTTAFDPTISFASSTTTTSPTTPPPTGSSAAGTTYRASTDYSAVQGQRNWFYLDSLSNRMTFNTAANVWQGPEPYMVLGSNYGHPGTTLDAVRRWVAPGAGTAQISGTVRDLNSGGGGGVTVAIRKGTTVLWQQSIANGNTTGVTFNVSTTLAAGDAVDFVINRGADGSNSYDTTAFDPTIIFASTTTTSPTTPPPTTGTAAVTLSWNKNTESDLSFYRVYYGTSSRNYSNSMGVGTALSSTISNLTPGTIYYFAVTAVDTSGNESAPSGEVAISR